VRGIREGSVERDVRIWNGMRHTRLVALEPGTILQWMCSFYLIRVYSPGIVLRVTCRITRS